MFKDRRCVFIGGPSVDAPLLIVHVALCPALRHINLSNLDVIRSPSRQLGIPAPPRPSPAESASNGFKIRAACQSARKTNKTEKEATLRNVCVQRRPAYFEIHVTGAGYAP